MAENDQEKTEYQSQMKLEQRRVKGEMSRSQELITFVVFALFLLFFGATRLDLLDGMGLIMGDLLRFEQHLGIGRDTIGEFMVKHRYGWFSAVELRILARLEAIKIWSDGGDIHMRRLRLGISMREKLIEIGSEVVRRACCVTF